MRVVEGEMLEERSPERKGATRHALQEGARGVSELLQGRLAVLVETAQWSHPSLPNPGPAGG